MYLYDSSSKVLGYERNKLYAFRIVDLKMERTQIINGNPALIYV